MSDSTPNLQQILAGANADTRLNELVDALSPSALYGRNAQTSSGLTWGYYGGRFGSALIANGTVGLTASSTVYITALRSTGAVNASTSITDWNDSTGCVRLHLVVTGGATVTSYQDHRQAIANAAGASSGTVPLTLNGRTLNYTLLLADAERWVLMNVATANNLTVPPNSAAAFPIGTSILVAQEGAGATTVVAGAGVTIRVAAPSTLVLRARYATATLVKRATDEWYLSGDLA